MAKTVIEGMRSGKTLLQAMLDKEKEKHERPPCRECHKSKRVFDILFCEVSGKMILPIFEDVCCCQGSRLEGDEN